MAVCKTNLVCNNLKGVQKMFKYHSNLKNDLIML